MREGIKLAWRLGLLMLVSGLCLGFINHITLEPIAAAQAQQNETLRKEALPLADEFLPLEVASAPSSLKSAFQAANDCGYVFEMEGKGFSGPIGITVGIDSDGSITGVRIGSHSETPGLGAKAADAEFYELYTGKSSAMTVSRNPASVHEIDALTAATITTSAVTDGVNDALTCFAIITGR